MYAAAIITLPEILNRDIPLEKEPPINEKMNNGISISDKVTPPNSGDSPNNNGSLEL